MPILFVDDSARTELLPLTYARPAADLRFGILTLAEKWSRYLDLPAGHLTADFLSPLYPPNIADDNLLVAGNLVPNVETVSWVRQLAPNTAFYREGQLVAARLDRTQTESLTRGQLADSVVRSEAPHLPYAFLNRPADLFLGNGEAITTDFELLTRDRDSEVLSSTNRLIGSPDRLFIEEGVSMEACVLNVEAGPIFIGKGATVLEGGMFRGPLVIGEGAVVKMGAKMYAGTTIGPHCKVGGEISNVVFQANSNKGHDGYLGNAVVGEWCNIGADTNASNLKNDYGEVKVWSYAQGKMVGSGLQFHGLIMGDHGKTGINTMLNTGTVIGFSANVFGAGFPPTFIPSFTWGGAEGIQTYRLDKATDTARRVMARRNQEFTDAHSAVFEHVFTQSAAWR